MYSLRTSLIILGMISTGAARSVGVKLLYQMGFDNYLFVALLYLFGQSLALVVYSITTHQTTLSCRTCTLPDDDEDGGHHEYARLNLQEDVLVVAADGDDGKTAIDSRSLNSSDSSATDGCSDELAELELQPIKSTAMSAGLSAVVGEDASKDQQDEQQYHAQQDHEQHAHPLHHSQSAPLVYAIHQELQHDNDNYNDNTPPAQPLAQPAASLMIHHAHSMPLPSGRRQQLRRRGSKTGLTEKSEAAVVWVHSIPWQLKPLIPGLFNLANAALKWASFVYVAASIAEMLMAGLELVLSVCVARVVRKRQISRLRWAGVGVVAVGLWVVHAADFLDTQQQASELNVDHPAEAAQLKREHWMGALLIVGQCVTAVGQDMTEELFLQEAHFPATLLLGMEGMYGLLFGIPLYLQFAPESILITLRGLETSSWEVLYILLLMIVFTVTGIFNIMTTSVTSSMTRNMWKNCRTILVWVLGLLLYYSLGNNDLGEKWVVPDSFFILGGFMIMLSGIYVYYKHK